MKQQTNLHSIKLLSLKMVAAMAIIVSATISASAQDQPAFKVGDRVEVQWSSGGNWYKAVILSINENNDGKYKVKYDTWGISNSADPKLMRLDNPTGEPNAQPAASAKSGNKQTAPNTTVIQNQSTFKVGDQVWAYYGDWRKGKIIEIKDGSYRVHFDNDWKQWVAPEKVRARKQFVLSTEFGTGLMTEEQVLSFVQTKTKNNSITGLEKMEVIEELVETIKARGVNFRYEVGTDFHNKFSSSGVSDSTTTFPLQANYGAPITESWLMGAWSMTKIGATVDYIKNNRVYRQGEIGVGNIGLINVKADGTYTWKSVEAQPTSGKWRQATREEMKYNGGAGIVLLKAKGGTDWIMFKNRETRTKGDHIVIYHLNDAIKEYGARR